jgi:AraC-like DNA-binding protein
MRQLREGFAGQDMFVIPRPVLIEAGRHPLIRSAYPTDIGWFPCAAHHYRKRSDGASEDHLMMCVEGHGYAVIDGQEAHLTAGELLMIPRRTPHSYWAAPDNPWSIYWVHFLGDDTGHYIDRIPRGGQPVPIDSSAEEEAVHLFRRCLDALYDGYGLPNLIYAAQSVQHILSLLLYRNRALPMEYGKRHRRSSVDSIVQFMQVNIREPLTLAEFAAEAGMSVSHFSELFRVRTGKSPMAYFVDLRIRHACRLLDLGGQSIKSVAVECGYRDPYYFSRVFKKVMGSSPDKYRSIKKG